MQYRWSDKLADTASTLGISKLIQSNTTQNIHTNACIKPHTHAHTHTHTFSTFPLTHSLLLTNSQIALLQCLFDPALDHAHHLLVGAQHVTNEVRGTEDCPVRRRETQSRPRPQPLLSVVTLGCLRNKPLYRSIETTLLLLSRTWNKVRFGLYFHSYSKKRRHIGTWHII